jgi:hypothetical protein
VFDLGCCKFGSILLLMIRKYEIVNIIIVCKSTPTIIGPNFLLFISLRIIKPYPDVLSGESISTPLHPLPNFSNSRLPHSIYISFERQFHVDIISEQNIQKQSISHEVMTVLKKYTF